jgi:predicted ATPase/class 3 adenylate cyclase
MMLRVRRDLPAGTVTFLFTDVEGSTRLLDEIGDEGYDEALAEHRRIVRAVCAAQGGVEVDTQGDAFFFAFRTAPDALAAASEMTSALASGPIQVRIGLHTGKPRVSEEGYVGKEVHFAARVASSGNGGQIVLSKATAELVDAQLTDLGEHRLKDISEPVAIFQVGEDRFPPLKTISNTNLPRPASSFVGRERELEEVLDRLEQGARLLTLSRPGGSGKTRLALEAATTLVPSYKAGVFWVGLAALRDPTLVPEQISQTLGAKDGLAEHIGERKMLLLVDNLEQVVEAAPELSALLETCPNLTFLCTSRELLRVRGEVEYQVPPLASLDAVSLFCERSGLESSDDIAELCARLDNLPLAVELAAARTTALMPGQILERLSQRLDLLKGGRDADPRQQTLRATIAWSYDLLTGGEQRLFRSLAVFAGGCTLEAAEEVCDADLDTLQSLVEKSLVRFSDGRYWMLETIREYAAERLEREDPSVVHARLAGWAVDCAAEPDRRERPRWRQSIGTEYPNVRAALEWLEHDENSDSLTTLVSRLATYWDGVGDYREGRRWIEAMLRTSDAITAERATARNRFVQMLRAQGDLDAARAQNDRVQEEAVALNDLDLLADAKANRGAIEYVARNLEDAVTHYEASIALLRQLGDEAQVAVMQHDLGLIALTADDIPRAHALFTEAHERAIAHGYAELDAGILGSLGYVSLAQGQTDEALATFRDAMQAYGNSHSVAISAATDAYGLAAAIARKGGIETACRLVAALDAYFETVGALPEPLPERARAEVFAATETHLSPPEIENARLRGRKASLEDAIAAALATTARL